MKKRHYNNGDVEFILESTILGYDPDDPHPEAPCGDATIEDTIELLRRLQTSPGADVLCGRDDFAIRFGSTTWASYRIQHKGVQEDDI